jgi:hypothetical protein
MTERWPTYNVLKACVLFVDSTAKAHYCSEVSKSIDVPITTAFNTLTAMVERGWLWAETETFPQNVDPGSARSRRVLYRLTEEGLRSSVELLTSLRVPVTGYHPSA